ncbi:hypothetical protein DCC81_10150 [Chitinophaga parva]|uniref:Uncharacterized protein n=1 Tax=Chitinophaga parva TaxID=2169414 RepID=A0A2T7BEI4_9BACT|nr:hypothetical protein [Chitinophaga parva]PUZ24702.1 hypothetical protein DCC81_10150 [Chitinophaga parva]
MSHASTLKIFILHRAARGREATFHDIDRHLDAMDEADYAPARFKEAGGGISIVLNNYLTLYRSTDFKAASDIVYFLLQSVSWLDDHQQEAAPSIPDGVTLYMTNGDIIRLTKVDDDTIAISYDRLNTRIPVTPRSNMFFSDVLVSKQEWVSAAIVALKEYQRILDWIVEEGNAADEATLLLTALSKGIDAMLPSH